MIYWIDGLLTPEQRQKFYERGDIDFGIAASSAQRFRINLFYQRQMLSLVARLIPTMIPSLQDLKFPEVVGKIAKAQRGLVLITGATGQGKSTTLAALVQKINLERSGHIITLEDPIEYDFPDINCVVNQREFGLDFFQFGEGLRSAMRQNPDVILVGEMRDRETIEAALQASETGHLVLSTLHTTSAIDSIGRILSFFPPTQHLAVRVSLAQSLVAIISQRLVLRKDNQGLIAAQEILIMTSTIREILQNQGSLDDIKRAITDGQIYGMQTFDDALYDLYTRDLITLKEAMKHASSPTNLELRVRGIGRRAS